MANPCITEIRTLVGKAKLERAINKFVECAANDSELSSTAILLSGRFHAMQRQHNMGLLAASEYNMQTNRIIHSLLGAIEGMENGEENSSTPPSPTTNNPSTGSTTTAPSARPKVFISYNHGDQPIALKIKIALEAAQIDVTIDVNNLNVGQNIAEYTQQAVRNTDITISLVSEKSLLSSWVASETLLTFMFEQVLGENKFFACYLDKEFLNPRFILKMVKQIDADIDERRSIRKEMAEVNIEAENLTTEISRLTELRNNAGKILNRLISSNTLDFTPANFDQNLANLITAIKQVVAATN